MSNKDMVKKRVTRIERVYSGDNHDWVDVEILTGAAFRGGQGWQLDGGNQIQDTILGLAEDVLPGSDFVGVGMWPEFETGEGGVGDENTVSIPTKGSAVFETPGGVRLRRQFVATNKKDTRKQFSRRLQSNDIAEEYLKNGQPPEDPDDYIQAVQKTKDPSYLWLDVYVPDSFKVTRNYGGGRWKVDIQYNGIWGQGRINLPGASKNTDPRKSHVRLDPYQTVINFGPDSLAVEFNAGAG